MNNENKSWVEGKLGKALTLVALLLALFLFTITVKEFKSISYVGKDVPAMNTVTVSGSGEAFKAPDIATFSFTIQDESLVVSQSQERVNTQVAATLSYLEKNGVEKKDIKTLNYSVYPRYEYPEIRCITYPCPTGERRLAGYTVSQSVSVKVRKLADAGKLVAGVGELGATELSGLQFEVDGDNEVLREARQEAITDAQTKAKQLAKDLGVRLVRIVNFSEGGNYPVYYGKAMSLGMGGDSASAPTPAQLPEGENQFISNVSITYEIR